MNAADRGMPCQEMRVKSSVMKRATFPTILAVVALAIATPALAQTPPPSAQGSGAASPKIDVKYSQFTLPNGLTVILHEDHSVPLVSTNMWYHVGSAREKPGRTGFAHLFEHLM